MALLMQLILAHTTPGEYVLDLFSGTFTTALACVLLKRAFIGCEVDTACFTPAFRRVQDMYRVVYPEHPIAHLGLKVKVKI